MKDVKHIKLIMSNELSKILNIIFLYKIEKQIRFKKR